MGKISSFKRVGLGMTPYTQADKVPVNSQEWRNLVNMRMAEGYGVEDIALWLQCNVSRVRAHVQTLRDSGTLANWWSRE